MPRRGSTFGALLSRRAPSPEGISGILRRRGSLLGPPRSTHDLTALVAAPARHRFENLQLAPLERPPLRRDEQEVEADRKCRERGEYNILEGDASREVRRQDGQRGRHQQQHEEGYLEEA